MGLTFSKIKELLESDDKVFMAIFTDGLENASTDYTAKDIRLKLAQADENGWQVKFFLQSENNIFYKRNLGINDRHILNITLNEAGLKAMENEVFYCIKGLADNQKTKKWT